MRRSNISISLSLDLEMVEKIDNIRGDVPRSRFITRTIEMMLNNHPEEIEKYMSKQRVSP